MVVALHKQGGGSNIAPQPIMKVEVTKTKDDNSRLQSSVRCLLYDARMKTAYDTNAEEVKNALKDIDPNMAMGRGKLESKDSRKAWENITRLLNERQKIKKSVDQCQRKMKHCERCTRKAGTGTDRSQEETSAKAPTLMLLMQSLGAGISLPATKYNKLAWERQTRRLRMAEKKT
ncbi:hypothetical protein ACROYT_G014574 [Oculina patagonica]